MLERLQSMATTQKVTARLLGIKSGSKLLDSPLADYLNNLIGSDKDLFTALHKSAGISSSTMKQILAATIFCPPKKRLEGFASIINKRGL